MLFDDEASEAKRRVTAVNQMSPAAEDTNQFGCPAVTMAEARSLHRDLMRGSGFFKSLVEDNLAASLDSLHIGIPKVSAASLWSLPTVDFMNMSDVSYRAALLDNLLPQDRQRFESYFSKRPLGLALIVSVSFLIIFIVLLEN